MRIYLERGNKVTEGVEFVRFVDMWQIDSKILLTEEEDAMLGSPKYLTLEVYPG